jgi:AcrR family transcriptional regulator
MSPRTKRQFEEIREERKTLIMNTALEHFAIDGFHSTTINHIARHAGISKGLMYNYFDSKESLLRAILQRSVDELYKEFDIDRDGYLNQDEFEYFVRRIYGMIREKQSFWRLLFQLLMQNEVREEFLESVFTSANTGNTNEMRPWDMLLFDISRMMLEYFKRKSIRMGAGYDPFIEMNMFIISIKGFALTSVFSQEGNEDLLDAIVEKIIKQYK